MLMLTTRLMTQWTARMAAVLLVFPLLAQAQARQEPVVVDWQLQVMRDGQQIDAFAGTTTVGQARTDTHHHVVQHAVGCKEQPGGEIDLVRTLTVSPVQADASVVTLALDTQETIEEPGARQSVSGCSLPPQPRRIAASHPGLNVPAGQWATWTLIERDPALVYRVRAGLAQQP
ncbi:hypothetical protein QS306_00375 [Paraburkholderia bonniea]|uniref:hypothetical protein n=1 Tax=Paraburkholderia bonniea TaxID=2152891 RepID=UPI001FEB8A4F|nr:hypothetical protein [Paraburkholderia bonniea]WJF90187.1 hypothetical protein QS306_00375 [Paraburkholderia bonniea]WJF93501.1 hypothetical protein QS308_00375 [Paraburkholderia bonniea]